MNKSVKGTLTEANLLKSFAGESQDVYKRQGVMCRDDTSRLVVI